MEDYKKEAKAALQDAAYHPLHLVLIYAGAVAGLTLITAVLNYLLEKSIGAAGGLSGIGTRAALETAQTILGYVQTLALPFWSAGYIYAMLRILRREPAYPESLFQGFRHIGAVIGMQLLRTLLYTGVGFAAMFICLQLLSMTAPMQNAMEALEPYMQGDSLTVGGVLSVDDALLAQISESVFPLVMVSTAAGLLAIYVFSYRYRLAKFRVMDCPREGGRAALWYSRQMMRGKKMALFRLDLCFWWYYLAKVLLLVVCYGDLALAAVGINLSWSVDVRFFVFTVLYLVCDLLLAAAVENQVTLSYCAFYQAQLPGE